jgi:outer membrane receptor protein involved in Fe transport
MKTKFLSQLFLLGTICIFGQVNITGNVKTGNELLYGVNIIEQGTSNGTTTDENGKFNLKSKNNFPITIEVSYLGFKTKEVIVYKGNNIDISINLEEDAFSLNPVVIGASRFKEKLIEAPISIERIGLRDIKNAASPEVYEILTNLKGVQANAGSMSFTSINARGFADPNNLRFIQHIDGMDITTPGFGIIGNTAGATDLDLKSIELIPGSSSALYGPDAFNGMVLMYTKNPFDSPGFSASWKTGVSSQSTAGTNPYNDLSLRYAHVFSDKLAFKFDGNHKSATDWVGGNLDYKTSAAEFGVRDGLLNTNINNSHFYNAVNRYGDGDFGSGVLSLTDGTAVTRTGILDGDLYDGKIRNYRVNASLHYKPNEDWEITYQFKHAHNDFSFRITTFYPFEDFGQTHNNLEAKTKNFTARVYTSQQSAKRTSIGFLTADFIQQDLKSNNDWITDYQSIIDNGGSPNAARTFADDYLDASGSILGSRLNDFNQAKEKALASPDVLNGGSKFLDNSGFVHGDLLYDFSDKFENLELLAGANFRRYSVDSEGTFFNDNRENGFTGKINYVQFGGFVQASTGILNDKVKLTGSLRYDKNENFDGNFTPRISAVYSPDEDKKHNFRVSYQTAFRNPGLQESFINFELFPGFTILGTSQANLDNYQYTGATGNVITGNEIKDALGRTALQPEQNKTFELGYKSLILNKKLRVDASFYKTWYPNFIAIQLPALYGFTAAGPGPDARAFLWYYNLEQTVTSNGFSLGLDYVLPKNFTLGFNYTNSSFDIPDYDASLQGGADKATFKRSLRFNTPESRIQASIGNTGFGKDNNLSFNIAFKATTAYEYESSFGATVIPTINTTDASFGVNLPKSNSKITFGGSNIFNQEYTYVYGGPAIGSVYYVGLRYGL